MKVEGWHIVILIVLAMLLFGAPRLPGLARSMGQSLRIFRSEVRQMKDENPAPAAEPAPYAAADPVPGSPVPGSPVPGAPVPGAPAAGATAPSAPATGSAVPVTPAPVPPVSVTPAQNGQISGT
ncbi:sec-independent protein translocase protein TatA [Arthrobacter sp. UYP6]